MNFVAELRSFHYFLPLEQIITYLHPPLVPGAVKWESLSFRMMIMVS